jgi:putative addiction module component (TIGR02574 family)
MASTIETIEAEALELPPSDRARLVERLIASLDADPDVEDAWAAEVERRHQEVESGAVAPAQIPRSARDDRGATPPSLCP